jgi:alpha-glucosidase
MMPLPAPDGIAARVEALAPDLFRLRLERAGAPASIDSMALAGKAWPPPETGLQRIGERECLATECGVFSWDRHGAWQLCDAGGFVVFSAAAGATGFSGAGAPCLNLDLIEHESIFGLGEVTGTLDRRGTVREFWNIDVLGHAPAIHPALPSLYVSIPFALSLRHGRAAGLFWDNPGRQRWDLGSTDPDRWRLEGDCGDIDLYLFLGPTVASVVGRYSQLTGTMPLPPEWALGYHQSRYSYETQARVEAVAREFRKRDLPCDAIHLDIHHMHGYRVFTVGKGFPDLKAMTRKLLRQGLRTVAIVDPAVKDDPRFPVLRRGIRKQAFVRNPDGNSDHVGEVWPGKARFPDFLDAEVRAWWGDEQRVLLDQGVSGIWNDMNEPANFARPDKTLPPDAVHRTDSGPRPHAAVHNLYGQAMAQASREGLLRHRPEERPFVVTRAGYAGIQRHAIVWTGDTSSHWDHLRDAVPMLLNLSLSGVPFCGGDVGGFLGNATPELFVRWLQFAAFTPFFRNHSNLGTRDQEPWAFGPEIEAIARETLRLRYQLLPLLYCLTRRAVSEGEPLIRPLLYHYTNDPVAVACNSQFLLGRDLLIAPVLEPGCPARSVYLPNDVWYDFWTGERLVGGRSVLAQTPLERIPVHVRAGTLLPLAPARNSTREPLGDTLQLHLWPGPEGMLHWYEDDGHSRAHESGLFHRRTITLHRQGRTTRVRFGTAEGDFASRIRLWKLIVWDTPASARVRIDGIARKAAASEETGYRVIDLRPRNEAMEVAIVGGS